MANSTSSYEDRIGKFTAGNTLVQSWGDYDATNPLITKAAYTAFIASVEGANSDVVTTLNAVGTAKDARRVLCFTLYDDNEEVGIINPDCAQERIIRVHSYLEGILPEGHATVAAVSAILHKIRPNYQGATSKKSFTVKAGETIAVSNVVDNEPAKNTGTTDLSWQEAGSTNPPVTFGPGQSAMISTESGNVLIANLSNVKQGKVSLVVKTGAEFTKSPMEKTFASLPGFLNEVITLVAGMAPGTYNPPDPLLSESGLTELHVLIVSANGTVTTTMDAYGTANRDRKKLYDGNDGMQDRIRLTKSYLASFSGGKKSEHFIEYSQAIKGS